MGKVSKKKKKKKRTKETKDLHLQTKKKRSLGRREEGARKPKTKEKKKWKGNVGDPLTRPDRGKHLNGGKERGEIKTEKNRAAL